MDEGVRRLQSAESVTRCIEIFAGLLAAAIEPSNGLMYVGLLTMDDRLQPTLTQRYGDDRWAPETSLIDDLYEKMVERDEPSWILNGRVDPVPPVIVKRVSGGDSETTFDCFCIGSHGVVIVGTLSPLKREPLAPLIRELSARTRQLDISKKAMGAVRDRLSSLLTYPAYQQLTKRQLTMGGRPSTARPVSLVILDLDNFKKLNTELGYEEANRVIASLADLIKRVIGPDNFDETVVGRFGGDEFMLTFAKDAAYAESVVERVIGGLPDVNPKFAYEESNVKLREFGGCTASAGIAAWPFDDDDLGPVESVDECVSELVRRANVALKKAKERKNCVVLYSALTESEKATLK
ncbi:hypothetical protein HPB50_025615 [Hyalomma asiaticum]|uniref:Uncharacterized protein n=1 Tax=Hyalomma asiaticum TaxID=266040 RepID=A0ACB7T9E8_HYAAI|nr:hypothetical protein HPB50_025615 [Hyalomma asiaticum]